MATNRRSITDELRRFALVNPQGAIKMVAVVSNIQGAVEIVNGKAVISRSHEDEGWRFLSDLYREDGRTDLWRAWEEHQAALRIARRKGQTIAAFALKFLPSEVQRRRSGQQPNLTTWTMPDLAPIGEEPAKPEPMEAERKRPGK